MVDAAQHPQHASRYVDGGRVEHGAVVGERYLVEQFMIVVLIERGPAAVFTLHAEQPGEGALHLFTFPLRVGNPGAVQRHQNFRGVVAVRIRFVVKLEGPAAGRGIRIFNGPVAGPRHLFSQHPFPGFDDGRMIPRQTGVHQRVAGNRRVPQRRDARLENEVIAAVDDEAVDGLVAFDHERVVVAVAHQFHRQHRVEHRRLNAGKIAFRFLMVEGPLQGPLQRPTPERFDRRLAEKLDQLVDFEKQVRPVKTLLFGLHRQVTVGFGENFGHGVFGFQRPHRLMGGDDSQRHHGPARPARHLVNVEVETFGKQDDFHRHGREVVPRALSQHGQKDFGEDPGVAHSAQLGDAFAGAGHRLRLRGHPRHAQRHIGFHRGADIARRAVKQGPSAVSLLGLQQGVLALLHPPGVPDIHKMHEKHVFRDHGRVGFQLGQPVAVRMLEREQIHLRPADGPVQRRARCGGGGRGGGWIFKDFGFLVRHGAPGKTKRAAGVAVRDVRGIDRWLQTE